MGGWKLFTFIFCQIDITLAHLSSAYSLSLQVRKSSFPSIFINGCQGYVSGALLRDNFIKIKILFIQKLFNFNEICWQKPLSFSSTKFSSRLKIFVMTKNFRDGENFVMDFGHGENFRLGFSSWRKILPGFCHDENPRRKLCMTKIDDENFLPWRKFFVITKTDDKIFLSWREAVPMSGRSRELSL